MKYCKRVFALLLIVGMAFALVACNSGDEKVYNKVYAYLEDKYKGLDFQVNSYVQDKEASGKYTVQVHCLNNNVEFEVIMSSLFMTDSYSASYVNGNIRDDLYDLLGDAKDLSCVSDIQWSNYYEENGEQYKFRDFSEIMHYRAADIHDIYRVRMDDFTDVGEVAECIFMFCDVLKSKGIVLDEVTFEFLLNGEQVLFTTDTESVEKADFEEFQRKLLESKPQPISGNLFYKEPDAMVKSVTYFIGETTVATEQIETTN